ncbi:MAG TPA: 2Fe-2S iron-sulfur cluster binding domain-containing protein [Symbiobacteriaceae bacterium]
MSETKYTTLMCLAVRGETQEEAGKAAARVYQDFVGRLHRMAPSVRDLRLEVDEPAPRSDLPGLYECWSRLQAVVPHDFRAVGEEDHRNAWRAVVRRAFLRNLRDYHRLVDCAPSRVELTRELLPWEEAQPEVPPAEEKPREMIPVRVLLGGTEYRVEIPKGENLLDGVNDKGVAVKWDCKNGVCDTCKVRVLKGMENLTPPTEAEENMLGDLLAQGYRLCCQVTANGPCEIEQ